MGHVLAIGILRLRFCFAVAKQKSSLRMTKIEGNDYVEMTWVKICGTTNLEDALLAVEAGADAVGFVFYEKSPRSVTMERAREIVERLPGRIEKVGVFVNAPGDALLAVADGAGLTAVQMHGDNEDPRVADWIAKSR